MTPIESKVHELSDKLCNAINDARKVYERGDISTYNVVITSVYSEPLEEWEEEE